MFSRYPPGGDLGSVLGINTRKTWALAWSDLQTWWENRPPMLKRTWWVICSVT